jgi:alpha-tubulin suppressor-like RCC1 family protein
LRSDGTVWAWGNNWQGQLGDNGTTPWRLTPFQVPGLSGVVAIAAGAHHSLALRSDGSVWAWGLNRDGQLGDGTTTNRLSPLQVIAPSSGITAVTSGYSHCLALRSDGTVLSWGNNGAGQLGDGTRTSHLSPGAVSGLASVTALVAGHEHSMALRQDGTVWAWGRNDAGQLGDGTFTWRFLPNRVGLPGDVTKMAAGGHQALVVRGSEGRVNTWGNNFSGQLGNDRAGYYTTPGQVLFP